MNEHVDVSYWPLGNHIRVGHDPNAPPMANLMALGSLQTPEWREKAMLRAPRVPTAAPRSKNILAPDEHMMCFDFLFFAGTWSQEHLEYYEQFSPVWNLVGRHMHINPEMLEIGRSFLHHSFGISPDVPTPPVSLPLASTAQALNLFFLVHRCSHSPR
jgi:hypothetical protein